MVRSILVVDDHPGIASALTLLLGQEAWGPILEAGSRTEAIEVAERVRPELVSVDLTLGDDDGVELVRQLREAHPHVVLVVLTASGAADDAVRCLRAGATAFIPKSCQPDEIVTAIEAAAAGHTWLPQHLVGPVISLLLDPPPASEWEELVATLSAREHAVLELMVAGLDRRAIADELVISLNTVRTHVKNILAKLGVHASLEAVSVALRAGMRPPANPDR